LTAFLVVRAAFLATRLAPFAVFRVGLRPGEARFDVERFLAAAVLRVPSGAFPSEAAPSAACAAANLAIGTRKGEQET
jgi:hypothetical protein